jgi:hypothetical protein
MKPPVISLNNLPISTLCKVAGPVDMAPKRVKVERIKKEFAQL